MRLRIPLLPPEEIVRGVCVEPSHRRQKWKPQDSPEERGQTWGNQQIGDPKKEFGGSLSPSSFFNDSR